MSGPTESVRDRLRAEVEEALTACVARLFAKNPTLSAHTPDSVQTEWNLAHHLATEVEEAFPDYDCDIEPLKTSSGNRRPDIVVHTRGTHARNFLVVEVKREGSAPELKADLKKIQEFWFKEPLRYRYGATINLRVGGAYEIQLIANRVEGGGA